MTPYKELTEEQKEERNKQYMRDLEARKLAEQQKELENLKLSESIAMLLDGAVTAPKYDNKYNNHFTVKLDAGGAVSLSFGGYHNAGRICVSGDYPADTRDTAPCITIAETKTAEQIAKDIQRRFLPAYQTAYSEALKVRAERDAYNDRKEAVRQALLSIPGVSASGHSEQLYISGKGISGTIKYITDKGTCNVDLSSVPVELLRALLSSQVQPSN